MCFVRSWRLPQMLKPLRLLALLLWGWFCSVGRASSPRPITAGSVLLARVSFAPRPITNPSVLQLQTQNPLPPTRHFRFVLGALPSRPRLVRCALPAVVPPPVAHAVE